MIDYEELQKEFEQIDSEKTEIKNRLKEFGLIRGKCKCQK